MAQLGCWLIGEFGEMLVNGSGVDETGQSVKITPDEIIDTYVDVLDEMIARVTGRIQLSPGHSLRYPSSR